MLKSLKSILAGLIVVVGTSFVSGILIIHAVFPILNMIKIQTNCSSYIFYLVPAVAAGLLSGHFVAKISGRRELIHTFLFLCAYIAWHIPSLIRGWGLTLEGVRLALIAFFALLAAFIKSRQRAQPVGTTEEP